MKAALRSLYPTARAGARAARAEFLWQRLLAAKARPARAAGGEFPVAGRYLVSSEKGVYRVTANLLEKLCDVPAFGIAVADDRLYLASWRGDCSIVVSGDRDAALRGGDCGWRELYRVKVLNDAGRIHQIGALGDALWLCNTALNTYTKIDRHTGRWLANIGPFRCSFGHPILVDHNHVNSVFPQPDYLLFSAFKINRRSAFGLAGRGLVRLFAYPNMGVHDCIIAGDDFYFSDSYRFWDGAAGGAIVRNGEIVDRAHFDRNAAFFVRGIAGDGGETVVGNSHAGDRRERFQGQGALILIRDGAVTHRIPTPFAQVYDIIREDGAHFDRPPGAATFEAASAILERDLGPCIEEFFLRDVLSGERQKKFADSDIGEVGEYLQGEGAAVPENAMIMSGR